MSRAHLRGVARRALARRVAALGISTWVAAACGGGTTSVEPAGAPAGDEANPELEQSTGAPARSSSPLRPQSARCELPEPGYGEECNSCLAARCCEPLEACKADASCGEQLSCVVDCQSADDPGRCSLDCLGPAPAPGYATFDDCSFTECLRPCWD